MAAPLASSTFFAPAERASESDLKRDYQVFRSLGYLSDILDALPYIAAILNSKRQIVYSNQGLMDMLGKTSIDDVLGKRVGEALDCIHATETAGGCGTSESCRFCGAVQAMVTSQTTNERVTEECRITANREGGAVSYDLSVTATPFHYNNSTYTVFALKDIGDEKRRRALEQIFFHDIINHAQSVTGLLTFAKELAEPEEINNFVGLAHVASLELMDGILSQRDLLSAERGEIRLMKRILSSSVVLQDCVTLISHHFAAHDRHILTDEQTVEVVLESDETLLKRILINMIKNALEATPLGGTVHVGCEQTQTGVRYWVRNSMFIPRQVQLQIFQRSYSTKGANRGLGTYSMKLLGEQFLKGRVYFTTDPSSGTTFYFDLPA